MLPRGQGDFAVEIGKRLVFHAELEALKGGFAGHQQHGELAIAGKTEATAHFETQHRVIHPGQQLGKDQQLPVPADFAVGVQLVAVQAMLCQNGRTVDPLLVFEQVDGVDEGEDRTFRHGRNYQFFSQVNMYSLTMDKARVLSSRSP